MGTTTSVCQFGGTVPNHHMPTQRYVNQYSTTTSKVFGNSGTLSPRSCLTTSLSSFPVMDEELPPTFPNSAFSTQEVSVGLKVRSKYSFNQPNVSSVEVSSTPAGLYNVLEELGSWHFARIASRPSDGTDPWSHWTPPTPKFLFQLLPEPDST